MPSSNAIRRALRRIILATSVYYIWKERNTRLFANERMTTEVVLNNIKENIRLHLQRMNVKDSVQVRKVATEWNVKMTIKVGV